ncbi:hypothetical protein Hanom_Chr13g01213261 [Helianthus anomalus]
MLDDLHEASSNEIKVLKLEIEALRADKAVKDEQLTMLYIVMEHQLGINVQVAEKELAEAATQKKKDLIIETQEVGGSSSQPASNDVEMVDAEVNVEVEHMEVDQDPSFVLIGDLVSRPYNLNDVIRMVKVEQRKGNVRPADVKLLCYKEEIEGGKEEEEEKIDEKELDQLFDDIDNYPEGNDDDEDQGATGLLIVTPSVQQSLDDFLNDEINEQQEDQHQESSSSGKQQSDQVFLTQPKVIYLNYTFEGEIEVPRTRAEMLEELGFEDGNLKFDIEDEIPSSPEKEYAMKQIIFIMLKLRSFKRPLQYFTHHADISLGDIVSWGYLEDLQVYAIRREQGVQYFEFLSDIQTLPWWDVEELV